MTEKAIFQKNGNVTFNVAVFMSHFNMI